MRQIAVLLFIFPGLAVVSAGDPLLIETFDTDALSGSWDQSKGAHDRISVHNATLCIDRPTAAGAAMCRRELPLGDRVPELISIVVRLKAESVSVKPNHYNGIKVMLKIDTDHGTEHPQLSLPVGSLGWSVAGNAFRLPPDTRRATLCLGLEKVSGKVWIDNVAVHLGRPYSIPDQKRTAFRGHDEPRLRGVMHGPTFNQQDIDDLAAWGANQVRWQLNWTPMKLAWNAAMNLDAYDRWLDGVLDNTDQAINACEQHGIKVLLDLHCAPGGRAPDGVNRMFTDRKYQQKFIDVWLKLARRYRGRDIIYAYDLINEPSEPHVTPNGLMDWRTLATHTATKIREIDPGKPIVFEPGPWGKCDGFDRIAPLDLDRVIYSFHMYQPHAFTHQFQQQEKYPRGLTYPGVIDGVMWDKAKLRESMKPALDFQRDFGVHIYVGEFSAIRWAPDNSAFRYLLDLIDLFEDEGWDWSYHAYREFHGWSVEHTTIENELDPSLSPTPRLLLLKRWFRVGQGDGRLPQ